MKIKSLYLAHPWDMHEEVRKWELQFEKKHKINLDNPFFDTARPDVDKLVKESSDRKQRYTYSKQNGLLIVEKDLRAIEENNGLIAFLEYGQRSFGTPMEIFYSSMVLQKPTYIISKEASGHPWIRGLATKVFKTKEAFEKYIIKQNKPK